MKKNNRQKVRFTLVLISLMFFPVTIYYMSPAMSIVASAKGILNISLLFFFILFISSLFLGRAYCGWVCPGSGLTDVCMLANDKPINRKHNWIKYLIWIPWMALTIFYIIKSNGFNKVDLFYGMENVVSLLNSSGVLVYYIFVFVIILLSLLVGRHSFCHHVCWMAPFMIAGSSVSNFLNMPALRIKANPKSCTDCKICDKVCPMSINVSKIATSQEYIDSADCTLCGECVDACKKQTLSFKFERKSTKQPLKQLIRTAQVDPISQHVQYINTYSVINKNN